MLAFEDLKQLIRKSKTIWRKGDLPKPFSVSLTLFISLNEICSTGCFFASHRQTGPHTPSKLECTLNGIIAYSALNY